jgi:hypothetical protein
LRILSAEGLKAAFAAQVDHERHVIANHGIYYDRRTSQVESLFLIPFPFLCRKTILILRYTWVTLRLNTVMIARWSTVRDSLRQAWFTDVK